MQSHPDSTLLLLTFPSVRQLPLHGRNLLFPGASAAAAAEALSGRSPAVLELCFLHEGHHGSRARVPVSLAEPAGSWGAVEHFWGTGSILSPGRISYSRPLS